MLQSARGRGRTTILFGRSLDSVRLKRSMAQHDAVERDDANQNDGDRDDKGDGPQVFILGSPDVIQKPAVLPGRRCQSQSSDCDQAHAKISWRLRVPNVARSDFVSLVLEELVDAETETNHRDGSSDPRHQGSLR